MECLFQREPTEELKEEALKLCREFIGGPWKHLRLEDFKFSVVSGGLTNSLYHCALPNTAVVKGFTAPSEILLRYYGPLQEDPNAKVTEAATFMLLSERNLGPKLYGIFPKGRLEEFIPSRSLNTEEIKRYSTTIAREMAKIHALNVPVRKEPDFWFISLNKWLKEFEESSPQKLLDLDNIRDIYKPEIDWLWSEMTKSKSPSVYCHNDLQGGNILLEASSEHSGKPRIRLIDFEFGAYNYRSFDIANQFCEWCFDYNTKEYPHFIFDIFKFPSEQEQHEYISAYLYQLTKEGVQLSRTLEEETKVILEEIKLFCMPPNLMWALWSVKMILTTSLGFAHREHMKVRWRTYKMYKENYLKSSAAAAASNGEISKNG